MSVMVGILSIDTEFSGNNREINPRTSKSVSNCWIPWCTKGDDFPAHHIAIIDSDTDTVLFYIWQRQVGNADSVHASTKGFEDPGPQMPGGSQTGRSYNLFVDANGVSANES